MAQRCRVLAGEIFLKDLSIANQPYLSVGNATAELVTSETEQTQPDYTSVAGGNACSIKDIDSVGLNLTLFNFDAGNIALAVFGTKAAAVGGAFTSGTPDNITLFSDGALCPLAKIPTNSVAVVKIGATTYVQNTDYTVGPGGVRVIPGSALDTAVLASPTGTPKRLAATAEYTYGASDVIEALKASGKTYAVRIEGKNRADNSKAEIWDIWKLTTGPAASFNVITREFGEVAIAATVTPDTSKPNNESQYFRITVE